MFERGEVNEVEHNKNFKSVRLVSRMFLIARKVTYCSRIAAMGCFFGGAFNSIVT